MCNRVQNWNYEQWVSLVHYNFLLFLGIESGDGLFCDREVRVWKSEARMKVSVVSWFHWRYIFYVDTFLDWRTFYSSTRAGTESFRRRFREFKVSRRWGTSVCNISVNYPGIPKADGYSLKSPLTPTLPFLLLHYPSGFLTENFLEAGKGYIYSCFNWCWRDTDTFSRSNASFDYTNAHVLAGN